MECGLCVYHVLSVTNVSVGWDKAVIQLLLDYWATPGLERIIVPSRI